MKEIQINNSLVLLRNELGFNLKNQEDFYNDILEEFAEDPFFMSQSPTEDFVFMEETLFSQNWVRVLKELNDHQIKSYKSIKSQVQLYETSEEIAKFVYDRMNEIQMKLQDNKWSHFLDLKNFHLVLNKNFVVKIFHESFSLLDGKLYKWQTAINPHQRWDEDTVVRKYQEIVKEDFFSEFSALLLVLSEAKLLQIFKRKMQEKQKATSNSLKDTTPNFDVNLYPKVFKSAYGCELFKYLVKVEDEKIGPAWAGKYFELFQDEKLIKKPTKKSSFTRFLKSEFGKKIGELDKRASYTDNEMKFLKDLEKDFQKLYNVNR